MKKKRYFPCQYCKGDGGWCDDQDDLGYCINWLDCWNCDGKGMIEIGGKIQWRNKALKAGMKLIKDGEEVSYEEILSRGLQAITVGK